MNLFGWHWSVAVGRSMSVGPRPVPVDWALEFQAWWLGPVALVRWRFEVPVPGTHWDVTV